MNLVYGYCMIVVQSKSSIIGAIIGHTGDGNFHMIPVFKDDEGKEQVLKLVTRMGE